MNTMRSLHCGPRIDRTGLMASFSKPGIRIERTIFSIVSYKVCNLGIYLLLNNLPHSSCHYNLSLSSTFTHTPSLPSLRPSFIPSPSFSQSQYQYQLLNPQTPIPNFKPQIPISQISNPPSSPQHLLHLQRHHETRAIIPLVEIHEHARRLGR